MESGDFYELVRVASNRSDNLLLVKGEEYTTLDGDRLGQFKQDGATRGINPVESLMGMAAKHYSSIVDMAKRPTSYNLKTWQEKLDDLRNYTLLCEGVLIDLGVE